jgi:WD40 repeat protein/formylglycine-generating enzyme required for sulfatase activity/tetratricopeptide (TPR) repeat protein/tRNA A-37 threonylcarbamoyl transferase component Bud32
VNDCPAREQLARLLAEQLPGPEAGRVEAHVQGCAGCQQILDALAGGGLTGLGPPAPAPGPRPEFLLRLRRGGPDVRDTPDLRGGAARTVPAAGGPTAAPAEEWPEVPGYEILGELGRGGMGVVYKARQTKLNRLVALKMVLAGHHAGPQELARFRAEAEAVARLQHHNVVQIFEVGEAHGHPFFSLEYCPRGSLHTNLHGTPLPPRKAAGLAEVLARALAAAHAAGVVHRDLKPANVLVAADGRLKVTDFGLAKRLDDSVGQTASGAIMGTPSYMAPEQAEGKVKEVGPATDVYALGAVLYELLTGRPPFKAATPLDTMLQVLYEEPVRPGQLQPKTPPDLETICLKCLQKEPHKRYPSALALADDLRRFLKGDPVQARPVGRAERLWRWGRRNRTVAVLSAAAVLLLLAMAVVFSFAAVRLRQQQNAVLEGQRRAHEAESDLLAGRVETVLTAAPESVPSLLDALKGRKAEVVPDLVERLQRPGVTFVERLRLNVALAALGEERTADLCALAAETPPGESFNLVLGLKCCDRQQAVERLDALYRQANAETDRCRLSIALLELGAPRAARAEFALKANPSERVNFIHLFPGWHGDLAAVPSLLRSVDDSAFRSGLCLAMGSTDAARLAPDTQQALGTALAELYTSAPDGGTHGAAGWALSRRGASLPAVPATQGPAEGRRWFVNRQGMTLIAIEMGLFHPSDYEHPPSWDGPLQTVVLTRPFFMADQEVTADWYRRFLDSDDHPDGERLTEAARRADLSHAVAKVDWPSAILFCNWLSRAEGRSPCYRPDASGRLGLTCDFRANGYRLPTDAEWEYVFRCGTTTRFVTGDDLGRMPDYGRVAVADLGPGKTCYPNPWGLFDLLGNGWEMCWDEGYAPAGRLSVNPVGAVGARVSIRGGAFDAGPAHFQASMRLGVGPNYLALLRPVCGPLEGGAGQDEKDAALTTLTRALERFPESRPQVWQERGHLYAELGQDEKAAADYARALELAPGSPGIAGDVAPWDDVFSRVAELRPRDARLWLGRADWLARGGRWREAAAASGRAVERGPDDASNWFADAVLRLQAGDPEGYRRDCGEMLKRFHDTKAHYAADYTAKTCLLLPDAVPDLGPVLELARRPLAGTEKDVAYPWFLICKALAEYRAGRFDAAVEGLNHAAPNPKGGSLDATAYVILALAEHRRGRPAEARQALVRAQVIQAQSWVRVGGGQPLSGDWDNWLRCEALRREAEALVDPGRRSRPLPDGPALAGHTDVVLGVAYHPGGRLVATGSRDRTIKLWDPATRQVVRTLEGHAGAVRGVAFSADGRRLLSGSLDRTVRLWDVETGRELRRFEGHADPVNAVAFSPDGRRGLSGGEDKTARLWDLETGKELRHWDHPALVTSVAFSPDGRRLASGCAAATMSVWDAESGRELRRFVAGRDSWVTGVAFSPDGRQAICAGGTGSTLQLWDVDTGKSLRTFEGHTHFLNCLALSRDGRRLLSGALDRTLRVWDVATGRELFVGYADVVRAAAFSPDGRSALTCGEDNAARLWDLPPDNSPPARKD